jgi:hypothetical protein
MFLAILTVEAHIRQQMLVPILAFEGTGRTIKCQVSICRMLVFYDFDRV